MRAALQTLPLLLSALLLSGCDLFGGESAEAIAARREADGKAIGGACRHAGRAIEDCYTLYRRADKSAVYAGWREMNDYMRENKLDPVAPQLSGDAQVAHGAEATAASAPAKKSPKPAATDKPADKAPEKTRSKEAAGAVHDAPPKRRDS
jgi:hypothetical protein